MGNELDLGDVLDLLHRDSRWIRILALMDMRMELVQWGLWRRGNVRLRRKDPRIV